MIKFLHILGVLLFLGDMLFSLIWRAAAVRSGNMETIKFTLLRGIRLNWVMLIPSAILIGVTGHMLAPRFGGIAAHGWIYHSYALLTVSLLIWLGLHFSLHKKMLATLSPAAALEQTAFPSLHRWWMLAGGLATLLSLIAVYLMVLRPG